MSEMDERIQRIRNTHRETAEISISDALWLFQKTEYASRLDKATDGLVEWYNEKVAKKDEMIIELTKKLADKEKNNG